MTNTSDKVSLQLEHGGASIVFFLTSEGQGKYAARLIYYHASGGCRAFDIDDLITDSSIEMMALLNFKRQLELRDKFGNHIIISEGKDDEQPQ